jgi:GTP-sensing pleiotropic transcriptional regulator CodY
MIFLTEKIRNGNKVEVLVYDSLKDLAQRVDRQDIQDKSLKILDEEGNVYIWDESKRKEVGTVFDYSFKTNGTDTELIRKCKDKFTQMGQPDYFELDITLP